MNGDRLRKLAGRVFLLFCLGLWGLTTHFPAEAARVSGEEGVTPAAPPNQGQFTPRQGAPTPQRVLTPQRTQTPQRTPILQRTQTPQRITPPLRTQAPPQPVQATAKDDTKKVTAEEKTTLEPKTPDKRYVTIDFDDVDIAIFIKFISELTGKNFVVDKAVKGRVTIISPTKISVKEAYKVFESVLEVHGYTTVPAGKITKIVPAVEARSKDIETRLRQEAVSPEDKVVTQLIPLRYANPDDLKKLFAPMISKSSVIASYPPTGMLIVTDVLSNITRLLRITEAIDVEGTGEQISVVQLKHATASNMATSLTTLFQRTAGAARRGAKPADLSVIKIVPDERTNVLIILASEDDTLRIKQLLELLDRETPRGEGDIRVYYLQNANAEDLAKVLMAIPAQQGKTPEKGKAPVVSKEVQIVADKATNSLVITANRDDYLVLEDVIKKLDITRRMVYIEALLMEVSVNKQFDLGVQWQVAKDVGSWEGKGVFGFGASTPTTGITPSADQTGVVSLPTGLVLGVLGEAITIGGVQFPNIQAVIRAFQSDSDVHILSTPQIMTTDNQEAEIQVAKNIPFLTRQEQSIGTIGGSSLNYNNYEFKDVGVILNITPQINQERFVRLKISQEVSQVVDQADIGLPTTLKRQAKTTVIIKDGHTVVIGGLIEGTLNQGTAQVPCLGSVPGIGWLFKSVSRTGDETNLYIFITPHIIETPAEAAEVYKQKKGQIDKIKEGVIKMYKRPSRENRTQEPQ